MINVIREPISWFRNVSFLRIFGLGGVFHPNLPRIFCIIWNVTSSHYHFKLYGWSRKPGQRGDQNEMTLQECIDSNAPTCSRNHCYGIQNLFVRLFTAFLHRETAVRLDHFVSITGGIWNSSVDRDRNVSRQPIKMKKLNIKLECWKKQSNVFSMIISLLVFWNNSKIVWESLKNFCQDTIVARLTFIIQKVSFLIMLGNLLRGQYRPKITTYAISRKIQS